MSLLIRWAPALILSLVMGLYGSWLLYKVKQEKRRQTIDKEMD